MELSPFTNREIAALITAALALFLVSRTGGGLARQVRGLARMLVRPPISTTLLLYAGWVGLSVHVGTRLGLWNLNLLKATALWFALSGLALIFQLNDAIQTPGYFRRATLRTLRAAALVEFLAGLQSFPLVVELVAQPLGVLAVMALALASTRKESIQAARLAGRYLIAYGTAALLWSLWRTWMLWSGPQEIAPLLRELALPLWLTGSALVFVYGLAVVAAYEVSFKRMRIGRRDGSLLVQRAALMLRANVRMDVLRAADHPQAAMRISEAADFASAWKVVGDLRHEGEAA